MGVILSGCILVAIGQPDAMLRNTSEFLLHSDVNADECTSKKAFVVLNMLSLPPYLVSVLSDWVDSCRLHPITPSTTVKVCT